MIAGTTTYSNGEFIYDDYLFDDAGPSGSPEVLAGLPSLIPPQQVDLGRAQYPHDWDRYGDNAADLVEVRVTADTDAVYYRFRLNTLMVADSTVVGLAVDEDGDLATGGGDWALGANISVPGWEHLYTVWGTGAGVSTPGGVTADIASAGGAVRVDLEENLLELRVPRAFADPGTGTWRMWAASGLWDPSQSSWLAFAPVVDEQRPSIRYTGPLAAGRVPNIFNVAFRSISESDDFGSYEQSVALTSGDISKFSASVDFARIADGESDPLGEPPTGVYTRIYRSSLPGEGIVDLTMRPCWETVSVDNRLGRNPTCHEYFLTRYQPYQVYVPTTYDPQIANPLVVTSHGYNGFYGPDIEFAGGYGALDKAGAVVVSTLARGQGTAYVRAAERDTLEVIEDAQRRYSIDPDRVSAVGSSHGGAMVWIMATLHPDLFSAAMPMIPGYIKHTEFGTENDVVLNFGYVPLGPEGDRLQHVAFKVMDLFENLRNVPVRVVTGDQDPASPPGWYEYRVTDRLEQLGYDYLHYGCTLHTHGATSTALGQQLLEWLVAQERPTNPRSVVYKGNTGADAWNEPWGNRHDGAYWVQDVGFSDPGRTFMVSAQSQAIPDVVRTPRAVVGQEVFPTDAPPSICHYKGLTLDAGAAHPVSNSMSLDLANVSSLTIAADRAGLSLDEGFELSVSTDHDGTLLMTGLRKDGGIVVEVDGEVIPAAIDGEAIRIELFNGNHVYRVRAVQ